MFGCGSALYLLFPCAVLAGEAHPVLPPRLDPARLPGLRRTIEPIMALGEAELLSVIPTQSGIFFTDCPNCTAGIQETQFASRSRQAHVPWELSRPTVMRCTWCGHEYPSAKYPMEQVLRVHNPRGELQEYPYWADAKGYKHFFAARIDEHRIRFMEYAANQLARAYALSGEAAYARRCALILHRFAEVFPGYCYHSDYPFREKVIVDGPVDPQDFRSNYRTARWTWWAYKDIPARLIEAWDLIASSGELARLAPDAEAKVTAFFTSAVEQVLANPDDLTNMSPGMWTDIIAAGRILGRPEWVHEAVARIERFFDFGFFHDGAWSEGAPSYSQQVIGNLREVFATARGHSDPPGYRHPVTGRRFEALDLEQQLPGAARVRQAYDLMRLPNGRLLPIHDTWSSGRSGQAAEARPFLLPGLGLGALAGMDPEPWQAALTWSPGMGHAHYDGLSLLLYAGGKELLSDLGYTHSRDRAWTLPTLAHNTVVIDHLNQTASPATLGDLRAFGATPEGQVVAVDNPQVYPDLAKRYRRTLVAIPPAADGGGYLVDLFEVEGGQQHDYLLHGCADLPGSVGVAAACQPLSTLLPEGVAFAEARHEGESRRATEPGYAYGYLRDLREVSAPLGEVATVSFAVGEATALRAHLLTASGDRLILGRNPAVRGAGENDDRLRDHWRPCLLWRRSGGSSLFANVIEPLAGDAAVTVRRRAIPGAALALEVQTATRHDLLLFRSDGVRCEWAGRPLTARAEVAVLRGDGGALLLDGELTWGDATLRTPAVTPAPLLAVDRAAGALTVQGTLLPPPGAVVVVDHAGQRGSAYTVVASKQTADQTVLRVAEDPGFTWNAATATAQFACRPGTTHLGPHTVSWRPIASGRLGGGQ